MILDYKNIPCVISYNGEIYKVEKPNKFFSRNRHMNDGEVTFHYIDESVTGMQNIAKELQRIEDELKGITRTPKQINTDIDFKYQYRLNVNTLLCAGNEDDFNRLKKWYNVE